jgi:hypothetical protein
MQRENKTHAVEVLLIKTVTVTMPRPYQHRLNLLKNALLELALHLLALLVCGGLTVEGHERAEVELGLLEKLDLADVDLFDNHVNIALFLSATVPSSS